MEESTALATGMPNMKGEIYLFLVIFVIPCAYIVYYRYLHPLSNYPGPLLASFSNLWKAYHLSTLHMPETITKLHEKYGNVVRVGPNDLSFNSGTAVSAIYKGGRNLPKTAFYDGFTAFNPNLFGTQDESIHSIRRRQMSHAFSYATVKEMEPYIDKHLGILIAYLDKCAESGETLDLKDTISFFVLDVLGELAFSRPFEAQKVRDPDKLPPINDHIYLACLLGQLPEMLPIIKKILVWTPLPWVQKLFTARGHLKNLTANCVSHRLNGKNEDRKDLLTSLINAVDPETGARLTELDINTEAFAMLVAGSHTTSGTLTLLFAHLLQNPDILNRVVTEIDTLSQVSNVGQGNIYSISGLEQSLPYTMACVQENFRINPVFTMPLPRNVAVPGGMNIDGYLIPSNTTVFALNHVVHHNPELFGRNHDAFDPSRFQGPEADYLKRNLSPFSIGHRMCIGRNVAMTNLLKVLTTILSRYRIGALGLEKQIATLSVGISEKEGPLMCRIEKRHRHNDGTEMMA